MEMQERLARLDMMIAEGRIIRHGWEATDADGRECACLLAALSPEAGEAEDAAACPASVMPAWLAYLTPDMDDSGSEAAWPGMVRRYAGLAHRWHVLTHDDWRRLNYTARRIAVEDARPRAGDATTAVDGVLTLLRRAEAGEDVSAGEWAAAEAAARAAGDVARAARAAADAAADAAAWAAARAAAWDAARVARVARAAADAAAWAAAGAAAWAAAVAAAGAAARDAAWAAAWDRITAAILGAIEARIVAREQEA